LAVAAVGGLLASESNWAFHLAISAASNRATNEAGYKKRQKRFGQQQIDNKCYLIK
jgi:hypothetical protein